MDAETSKQVVLHVYDLSKGLAKQLSLSFLGKQVDGIWHTGVVIGDKEYFYGGGIQVEQAGRTVFGQPVEVMSLGETCVPDEVLMEFLSEISTRFGPEHYSILHNNCNNFSDELASFLTGRGIPEHITGLPSEFISTPLGQMVLPLLNSLETQLKQMSGQPVFPGSQRQSSAQDPSGSAPCSEPANDGRNDGQGCSGPHAPPRSKAEFEAAVRAEFERLTADGSLSPNEAAAEAIRRARRGIPP
uniref:Desumoylating isopeptidase 1-like isoform x1 n=1 Tax=Tetraselmis sp. GSL018 TaxID=582737 RepID=A0A061SAR9_9CHLO